MLAVVFGTAQNIMSKSAKYSLFDPTKEMAYIPLDQESKVKGKAAIDVVGARLGKSGGSLVQQGLIIACGSLGSDHSLCRRRSCSSSSSRGFTLQTLSASNSPSSTPRKKSKLKLQQKLELVKGQAQQEATTS